MLSDNVTVCIFAMNEEERVFRCINNFKGLFRNILIVDNFSSDRTRDIGLENGCRCVSIKNPGFIETEEVMSKVYNEVYTDYMLIASVSEYVPYSLLVQYSIVAEEGKYDIARAYRQSVTAGLVIPMSGKPCSIENTELRFFKKGSVSYENNKVHGRGKMLCTNDKVLVLLKKQYWFYQFRDYDCGHTEIKHAGYNNVLAQQMHEEGMCFSWSKMIFYSCKQFFVSYILFGYWKYGMPGFIHAYYRFHMEIGIWLRLWEWQHGYDAINVRVKNSEFREKLEMELKLITD